MKCCDIHSGQLRHRISIYALTQEPDGGGGYTTEWVEYAQPMARVKPLSGTESLVAMQLEAAITHDIVIRYRTDVTPEDKIVLATGRELNIVSVINVEERDRWLELRCEEGVAVIQGDAGGNS